MLVVILLSRLSAASSSTVAALPLLSSSVSKNSCSGLSKDAHCPQLMASWTWAVHTDCDRRAMGAGCRVEYTYHFPRSNCRDLAANELLPDPSWSILMSLVLIRVFLQGGSFAYYVAAVLGSSIAIPPKTRQRCRNSVPEAIDHSVVLVRLVSR